MIEALRLPDIETTTPSMLFNPSFSYAISFNASIEIAIVTSSAIAVILFSFLSTANTSAPISINS